MDGRPLTGPMMMTFFGGPQAELGQLCFGCIVSFNKNWLGDV